MLTTLRRTTLTVAAALLLLTLLPLVARAQDFIKEYDTRPALSFTFDLDPKATTLTQYGKTTVQAAGSAFEYTQGAGSHSGVLSFDGGQDYLNFVNFYDDEGKNFTAAAYGEEMSFEVWASWTELRSWSRIFDVGNGRPNNNIFMGNGWDVATIVFNTASGSQETTIYAENAVSLYNWQHVVGTITKNPSTTAANNAAILTVYVNGVRVQSGNGYLPPVVARSLSWLGRSNWESLGDQRFRGLFDDFFIYNYSLSAEGVAAHYQVPRIARFEHTFTNNPTAAIASGSGSLNYGWASVDVSDSTANQAAHVGLITLGGDQFLNLYTYDGANAIGTKMPTIGGAGWPQADEDTVGWTFEVTVKFTALNNGACIFDFSNSGADKISMCLASSSAASGSKVQFFISNGLKDNGQGVSIDIADNIATGVWHTFVVNVQPGVGDNVGRYETYANGTFRTSLTTGVFPRSIDRPHVFVGRSFQGVTMRGLIDSLRVYDYSLTAAEVRGLYGAVSRVAVAAPTPLYTTAPSISHTFDVSVPWGVRNGGTKLGWTSAVAERSGIVTLLSTDTQYINLLTLPDRNYKLFPGFIGARSISFEFWVMWNMFNSWERILDISGAAATGADWIDNIFIATLATADTTMPARMIFSADGGPTGSTDRRIELDNAVYLNRWYHVVATVKVDRTADPNVDSSAQLQLYINGELKATMPSTTPRFVNRPYSWVGRSRYTVDGYFGGYIDQFHYYDYALELEQVRAHYAVVRPPLFELTFSSVPSQMPQMNATNNFGWMLTDASSSSQGRVNHQGLLRLTASSQHYIDLMVSSGTTTIGAVMPALAVLPDWNLYGRSSEFPTGQARSRLGITFETSFKATGATGANGKLFSCSAANAVSDMLEIGFSGSRDLVLYVHNSEVGRSAQVVLASGVVTTAWYHVVATLRPQNAQYVAFVDVMVNGVLTQVNVSGVYPYAAQRDLCTIGRSVTGASDSYFDGFIDTFRVYDYAVNSTEAAMIYKLTSPEVDPDTPTNAAASSSSSLSGGAIAGIVIACIVGAVIIAALLVVYMRSTKGSSSSFGAKSDSNKASHNHVELSEVREEDQEHESA